MDTEILAELTRRLETEAPDAAQRINRSLDDDSFRDMCAEYEDCMNCLSRWRQSSAKHEQRIEEYTQLIQDLEREILEYLREH